MMRCVTKAITVAAVTVGAIIISANGAQAASCPSGYVCMWGDRNYLTDGVAANYVAFSTTASDLFGINYKHTARNSDNDVTSVFNNGVSHNASVYLNANYNGPSALIRRGTGFSELNVQWPNFNDAISSAKFI